MKCRSQGVLETRHFRPWEQCNKGGWNNCTSTCFSADHFKRTHIFQDAAYRDCPHAPQAAELLKNVTECILLFRWRNKWCCGERREVRSRRESKPNTAKNSTGLAVFLQLSILIWMQNILIAENHILKNKIHITWQMGNNRKQSFQSGILSVNTMNCQLCLMHKTWLQSIFSKLRQRISHLFNKQ